MDGGMGWFFVGTLRFSGWFLCDKIFGLEDFLNYLWPGKIVWYLLDDFCLNVSLDLLLAMVLQIITIYVVVAKKNKTVRNHGSFMLIQSFDDHRVWMIPIFRGLAQCIWLKTTNTAGDSPCQVSGYLDPITNYRSTLRNKASDVHVFPESVWAQGSSNSGGL